MIPSPAKKLPNTLIRLLESWRAGTLCACLHGTLRPVILAFVTIFVLTYNISAPVLAQSAGAQSTQQQVVRTVQESAINLAIAYLEDVVAGRFMAFKGASKARWQEVFSFNPRQEGMKKYGALLQDDDLLREFVSVINDALRGGDVSKVFYQERALLFLLRDNIGERIRVYLTYTLPRYSYFLDRIRSGQEDTRTRTQITRHLLVLSLFINEGFAVRLQHIIAAANRLIDAPAADAERHAIIASYIESGRDFNKYLLRLGYYLYVDVDRSVATRLKLYLKSYRVTEQRTLTIDGEEAHIYLVEGVEDGVPEKAALGHRWGDSNYAIVFTNQIRTRETDSVLTAMRQGRSDAYAHLVWGVKQRQLGALRDFRELVVALYQKDFAGLSEAQILDKIINVTVAHEARHVGDRGRGYNYAEEEIRAFEAEIASGIAPYYSLAFFAKNVFSDELIDRNTKQGLLDFLTVARNSGLIANEYGDLKILDFATLNRMLRDISAESSISRPQLAAIAQTLLETGRPSTETVIAKPTHDAGPMQ